MTGYTSQTSHPAPPTHTHAKKPHPSAEVFEQYHFQSVEQHSSGTKNEKPVRSDQQVHSHGY